MDYFGNQNHFLMNFSDISSSQHECSIIYGEKFSLCSKNKQTEAWKRHQLRLQLLASPKRRASKLMTSREMRENATSRLFPRLKILSQPKSITQKFIKRPETPFELPGKIKDWER